MKRKGNFIHPIKWVVNMPVFKRKKGTGVSYLGQISEINEQGTVITVNGEYYLLSKRYLTTTDNVEDFKIGDSVIKFSGKKFPSGESVEKIMGFTINEEHPKKLKVAILSDGSVVTLNGLILVK